MGLKSSGSPGLILSARFSTGGMDRSGDRRVGGKDYGFSGAGALGKKESRAKGRGTGRANRLSSRGLRASSWDNPRRFFFLPSSIFSSICRARILLPATLSSFSIRPCDLDSRQYRIQRHAILIALRVPGREKIPCHRQRE